MCSTCYGGSSQLTDLLVERSPSTLRKHTFGIQGDADIVKALREALDTVNSLPAEPEGMRKKKTVLFVEVPTNPNMKVPDLDQLAEMIDNYVKAGSDRSFDDFLLMVDATFAPGSKVMEKLQKRLPMLPMFTFISMSKSVSRGMTTGGALVANGNDTARQLLADCGAIGRALDTTFKLDQARFLVDNHTGVEDRCVRAHGIATAVGETLRKAVAAQNNGFDMPLAFVKPEHAELGFTSSTFSFNLPRPEGVSDEETEAFAQKFVDILTENKQFKPCVSFGQDNGLIYCTVPATSTQGCIKPEDKALQAVGGVQLVRLSFPPSMNIDAATAHVQASVEKAYTK
jgi:cysteine synthase A